MGPTRGPRWGCFGDIGQAGTELSQIYGDGPSCRPGDTADAPFVYAAFPPMSTGQQYVNRFFIIVRDYYSDAGAPVDAKRLERIRLFPAESTFSDLTQTFAPVDRPPAVLTAAAGVGNW